MTDETLKGLLQIRQLPRKAKLLGILAVENGRPKGQRQIRATAKELGLTEVRRWRLDDIFAQAPNEVRLSRDGWQLTRAGLAYVESLPQLLLQMQMEALKGDTAITAPSGAPQSAGANPPASPPATTSPAPAAKPQPGKPRPPRGPGRR